MTISPGHQTFPRSTCRRPDAEYTLRSLMSRGSEGTLSTCSSGSTSSGLPTDPDMDSPGGAYTRPATALFSKCRLFEDTIIFLLYSTEYFSF